MSNVKSYNPKIIMKRGIKKYSRALKLNPNLKCMSSSHELFPSPAYHVTSMVKFK